MFSRRPDPRFNRGRIATVAGSEPTDPVSVAPLTIVTSVPSVMFFSADTGVTTATGVSAWADQSGAARNATQATTASEPALQTGSLNGRAAVVFDGVDDFLQVAYIPPAPGTTPSWYWAVFNTVTSAVAATIFGSTNTNRHRLYWANSTLMTSNCGTAGTNVARSTGQWYRGECFFNNSTTDYKKIGSTGDTGVILGNNPGFNGFTLGAGSSVPANCCNVAVACFGAWAGMPTAGEIAALDAWVTAYYGAGVEI